ncbi:discoidin domain-containing protein [Catenuloplanes sp. NPDC051500]|uniref:discoidin domain-containing protein n=1 Tax=Catenuloplanes sp. NPDC051500 TaxID=3363959 RepID=UPI0037BBC0B2
MSTYFVTRRERAAVVKRERRSTVLRALIASLALAAVIPSTPAEAARTEAAPAEAAPDSAALAATGRSAVYGGGPFYSGGQPVMDTLRASGFTTVVLWAIHVRADTGDLWLNDERIIADGAYVGNAAWPDQLRTLKQSPTSVNRIEVSVGSAGPDDWGAIDGLIDRTGTGSGSVLYRNFQTLRTITGADAINDDDEQHYDVDSTTAFARMVIAMGYRFTLVPYTNMAFWRTIKTNLGDAVDRVYLQGYAGGAGNNPATWASSLGMPVDPGLWSRHGTNCASGDSPATVESRMRSWQTSAGIQGGFMWLYDDMQACAAQGSPAAYAAAINNATGTTTPPAVPPGQNVAVNRPATGSASCTTAETPAKAVNGTVNGGTADKWCSLAATKSLQVDLGSSRALNGFVVRHAAAGGEPSTYNTRDYDVQTSQDGVSWQTVAQARGNTAAVTVHTLSATARYARLSIITAEQSGSAAARIYEFEVYSG